MKKILLILFFISTVVYAQDDWTRWEESEVSFLIKSTEKRTYSVDNSSLASSILSYTRNTYWFLISDLDGNNCPFHPSCSSFFVESVKETTFLKGALMFADRFTRDINLFNRHDYPRHSSGLLYDPVDNYKLDNSNFKLFPNNTVVQ